MKGSLHQAWGHHPDTAVSRDKMHKSSVHAHEREWVITRTTSLRFESNDDILCVVQGAYADGETIMYIVP